MLMTSRVTNWVKPLFLLCRSLLLFDPSLFYRFAGDLYQAADATEVTFRTIVGRAYYAAFLAARNQALIQTSGSNIHDQTITHYRNARRSAIASRLDDLRRIRNDCDYDCQKTVDRRMAGEALKTASKVLADLGVLEQSGGAP
jgi:uncharacterized protein (UPF0332 family)